MNKREILEKIIKSRHYENKFIKNKHPEFYEEMYKFLIDNNIKLSINMGEKLYRFVNDLVEKPKCSHCKINSVEYKTIGKGYKIYCSKKCYINSGHLQNIKEEYNQKTGYSNPGQNPEIIEKINETKRLKRIKKYEELSDLGYIFISEELDGFVKFKHVDCDNEFIVSVSDIFNRIGRDHELCNICNPYGKSSSIGEKEVLDYIKLFYNSTILENHRFNGIELDIYLPELNLGIEYNGTYWHSELFLDKEYHQRKLDICNSKNIRLFNVWEDDWDFKKEIIKMKIKNLIVKSNIVNSNVKVIDNIEANELFKKYDLKNLLESDISIGVYTDENISSLMSFEKINDNDWKIVNYFSLNENINDYKLIIGKLKRLVSYDKLELIIDPTIESIDMFENLGFSNEKKLDIQKYLVRKAVRLVEGIKDVDNEYYLYGVKNLKYVIY